MNARQVAQQIAGTCESLYALKLASFYNTPYELTAGTARASLGVIRQVVHTYIPLGRWSNILDGSEAANSPASFLTTRSFEPHTSASGISSSATHFCTGLALSDFIPVSRP